jgi:hypothetical protein
MYDAMRNSVEGNASGEEEQDEPPEAESITARE